MDKTNLEDDEAAKLLASALATMLRPNEGIVVEFDDHKYAILCDEVGGIMILADEQFQQFEHGQMLWAADTQEQADQRNELEAMGIPVDPNNPPEIH